MQEEQIGAIVRRVVERLKTEGVQAQQTAKPSAPAQVSPSAGGAVGEYGVHKTVNDAVRAAKKAFGELNAMPLDERRKIISSIRHTMRGEAERLANNAASETTFGRADCKLRKNLLAIEKTPGVEIFESRAWTGDYGLTLLERAPYGVIGSITPVTNPVATIVNNAIGMIAAGNAVVFNGHPGAKDVSAETIRLLNRAVVRAGGPMNLLACAAEPTIQSAQDLMTHPDIRLLVVTGGPAVVKVAMKSGKKVIAAGPGNPPVVVDETANIEQAGRDIVTGASFDNNIVCVLEKEIFAVSSIADKLKESLRAAGAVEVNRWQIKQLEKLIVGPPLPGEEHPSPNKRFVGKKPADILREIDVEVSDDVRLVLCEVDDKDHPFVQMEQLMPVMPLVRVPDVDTAIKFAIEAEHGFRHTAVMHSKNVDNLSRMAREVDCTIFVKNGPSIAGLGFTGEGYTSFSIASPTGEGLTTALNFSRERRCVLKDSFRIV